MAFSRTKNLWASAQRGQGVVEAIITLPVFLILVFGLFQLFLVSIAQVQLRYAAFCAARVGAVRNGDVEEMEAVTKKVLFGTSGFIPGVADYCRVEKLGPTQDTAGKTGRLAEESVELLRILVHWDYPLSFPVPILRRSRIGPGGIFEVVKNIPLQASWTTIYFTKPAKTKEGK